MSKGKEVKISYWAAHATTIVSVTLVLLIIGIIAMITISAARETRRLKESLEISVIMTDSISDGAASQYLTKLKSEPWVKNPRLITRAEALETWKTDTGEDLEALFGVNPLSPEITFNLPAQYSERDSIVKISGALRVMPGVEDVAVPESGMLSDMNENISRLSLILGGIAVVMLIISFVLINNTVHLTVFARRFLIHTMQLVGATNGFIRRPAVVSNMLAGVLSGVIASALLGGALFAAPHFGYPDIAAVISLPVYGIIAASLIIAGGLICGLAAGIATTRYLRKDYDDLFR